MRLCSGRLPWLGIAAAACLAAPAARADVRLPALFSDNAVIQAGPSDSVWGWANDGEKVTVTIDGRSASAVARDGKWLVKLPAMKAGGPFDMTITGKNSIAIHNVLVGEVWVASGQSNMEYGMGSALNAAQEVAAADYPLIHVFTVAHDVAGDPQTDVVGQWVVCSPQTAASFTAVGYFFSRDLFRDLKTPIGLIHSSVSGTVAEAWTRVVAMQGNPVLQPILNRYSQSLDQYQKDLAVYTTKLADYNAAMADANTDHKALKKPAQPSDPSKETTRPGGLFNGMIAPLIPYTIKGVIWWQGEYNSERCWQYRKLFPSLITDWRKQWGQSDFPFLFMQLQNLDIEPQPNPAHYDEMRESQLMTLSLPNTGMAVACDIGDAHNIHPPNKQAASQRLAWIAEATVYGKKIPYSGPIYQVMKVEGNRVRIAFNHAEGGLVSETMTGGKLVPGDAKLGSFVIAGADQKFVPADAAIDGATVVVSSPDVKAPVAVRYAWADNPTCTLYNKADLPASPFRTDDWPVNTTGKM